MDNNLNSGGFGNNEQMNNNVQNDITQMNNNVQSDVTQMNNNVQNDVTQVISGFDSVQDTTSNNKNTNSSNGLGMNNKTRNTNIKLIIAISCLVVVIAVGALLCVLALKTKNNSKIVFASNISKFAENLKLEEMQDMYSIISDGFTYKLTGDVDVSYNDSEVFKGTVKMNLIDNPSTKQQYLDFSITDKDNKTLALDTLIKDNKMYLNIKDVFDKYYYIDFDYIKIFYNYDNLKNNLLNSFKSYFTEDKLVETETSLMVNNKNVEVNKVSLILTEKDMMELSIMIMQNLLNDEKALQEIIEFAQMEEDITLSDLKDSLKDEIDYYKEELEFYDDETNEALFEYSMYMKPSTIFKNGEIVKQEIIFEDGKIIIEGDESGTFKVLDTYYEEVLFTGTFDKGSIKFNYESEEDDLYLNATLSKDSLTANIHDKDNKNNINMNYKFTNKYEKDVVKGTYDFKIDVNVEGVKAKASVLLNLEINNSTTIPTINVNNAKEFSNMTEEELTNILNKTYELPYIGAIVESVYSLNDYKENIDFDTNYDYDFDTDYDFDYDYDFDTDFDYDYDYDFDYDSDFNTDFDYDYDYDFEY